MAITNARMQMRRGLEADFDPEKMHPGEWAVSTDTKYVRICFSPGVCVRMATYEAFEADMEQIRGILAECQTVEEAVQRIYEDIKDVAVDVERIEAAAASALESEENALNSANSATQSANTATQKASEALNSAENAKLSEDKSVENAKLSESYAVGGTGTRTGEDTDNAKYYNQQASDNADRAKEEADRASSIANIGIATTEKAGIVKPDGITITVDADGTIHADNGTVDYNELENKPQINGTELSGNKSLSDLGIASNTDLQKVETKVDTIIEKAELNIKNTASGENIHLTDSASSKVVAFGLYGKAEQNGEPTPDNPIEINVAGASGSVEVTTSNEENTKSTTANIPTPNGLAGIKVSSNGNYTDQNGQQWICDEIVKYADGSGQRVQRVGKYVFDGSDDEGWLIGTTNDNSKKRFYTYLLKTIIKNTKLNTTISTLLCDKYIATTPQENYLANNGIAQYGGLFYVCNDKFYSADVSTWNTYLADNPMTVYYELAEQIITDLTAEEIAEIEKLHTFYPITNISNDADCSMEVTYIADSKLYIDNQLAIQKAQQEEALATMLLLMPEEVQASMIENDTNNLLNESEE